MNLFENIFNKAKSGVNYLSTGQAGSDLYDWANPETKDPIQRFFDDPAQDMSKKQALMDNLKAGVPADVMKSYVTEKYYKPVEFKQTVPTIDPTFKYTGDEGIVTGIAKQIGNIPSSLYNFGATGVNLASTAYQEGIPETAGMIARGAVQSAGQGAESVATSYRNQGLIGATNTVLEGANKFMMENPIDVVGVPGVGSLAMKGAKSGSQAIVRGAEALGTTAKAIPKTIVNAGGAVVKTPKAIVRSGVNALEKIKPGIKDDLAGIDPQSRYAVERATPERVSSIIEEAKQAKMSPDADYQQTPYHKGAEIANKTVDQIEGNLRKRQAERMAILEDVPLEKVNLENARNSLREELDKLNIEDITIDDAGKPVVVPKKGRSALLDQKNSQDMQAIEKLREVLSEDVSPLQTMDNIKILQEWLYENKGTIALKGISKKMEGIVSKIQGSMNKTFKDQLPPQYKKVMDSMSEDIQLNEKIKRIFGIGDDGNPVGNRGELVMKRLTNGTTTGGEARALAKEILDKYGIDLVQEARLRQLSMELVGDTRGANLFGVLLSGKKGMMDWTLGKVGDVLIDKENLIKSYAGKGQIVQPKKQPNLYTKPTKNGTPLRNTKNSSPIPDTKGSTKSIVRPSPKKIVKPLTPKKQSATMGDMETKKLIDPVKAIKKYTNNSDKINKMLREGKEDSTVLAVDEFISKQPSYKGDVYRGLTVDEGKYDSILENIRKNGIKDKAYTSTTENYGDATTFSRNGNGKKGIILEIQSTNGKKIDAKYNPYNEEEILFPRNTQFEYVGEYKDAGKGLIIQLKEKAQKIVKPKP